MSCSPFDLRDYLVGELADSDRRQVEAHVHSCVHCHEDLERLRLMHSTLLSLRDEEVPQRIGFVSDKVFEPSPVGRAWRAFWGSSAKLGFASAAMLSAALMTFAFFRPPTMVSPPPDTAKMEQQVSDRVAAAVEKAVNQSEARQARQSADLLAAAEKRLDEQRQRDRANIENLAQSIVVLQKQVNVGKSLLARASLGESR